MSKIFFETSRLLSLLFIFFTTNIFLAYSQNSITSIVEAESQAWILDNLINPVMSLVLAINVMIFFYGTFRFILNRNKPEQNSNGKKAMFWGLVGIFLIVSVWQIMDFVASVFNSNIRLR
jgi:hypothetical protein